MHKSLVDVVLLTLKGRKYQPPQSNPTSFPDSRLEHQCEFGRAGYDSIEGEMRIRRFRTRLGLKENMP